MRGGRGEKEMGRKEAGEDNKDYVVRERKKLFKQHESVRLGRIV